MSQNTSASTSPTSTSTRVENRQYLNTLRTLWLFLIVFSVGLFLYNLPFYFVDLRDSAQYGGGYTEVLVNLGISQSFFASYFAGVDAVLVSFSLFVAIFIFRIRSDDWLALLVSANVVILSTSTSPAISTESFWMAAILSAISGYLMMVVFSVFPDGRFVPSWMRYIIVLSFPIALGQVYIRAIIQSGDDFTVLFFIFLGSVLAGFAFILLAQVYRYRKISNQMQRQQLKWVILAFTVILLMFIVYITVPLIFPNIAYPGLYPLSLVVYTQASLIWMFISIPIILFTIALFPISILVGILRYRLWDIDVVINRSLVYGSVALISVAIFFIASLLIQVVFGNQQIWIALVFSLIVSAAIFNPIRKRVQNLVDRYIYRLRFDLNELGRAQEPLSIINPGMLTGQQFGDYEVRGVIGKGGMGEVYDGFGNGQRVAIKTMLPEIARDPDLKIRFEREVEIGLSLKNPHIAEVYSQGEHNGTPYLVMEHVGGQDLSDALKIDGKFDPETAIQIIKDICQALSLAHEQGYVHRDLKPSNIMLRENGSAVLMDFGISKIQDAKTITGTGAVGTIQYMAPEQIISSKDVDHRADIYALGCVLYQMLTGETPFSGGAAQVMFAQIQQPAPDPRDIQDDIPENVAEAILKTLEKDPEKRFNSVDEFPVFMSG